MKTSLTIRFGIFAISIALCSLLMSCKEIITIQKEADLVKPTPVTAPSSATTSAPIITTGDYKITGTNSFTINGEVSSTPISGTLTVYTGNSPESFYFLEKYKTYQRGYLTFWTGSTFVVEDVYDFNTYQYVNYFARQNGGGTVVNGQIVLHRFVNTNTQLVTDTDGGRKTYSVPINKCVQFTTSKS